MSVTLFLGVGALALVLGNAAGNATEQDANSAAVQGADLVASLGDQLPTLTPGRLARGFTPAQLRATDRALSRARGEGDLNGLLIVNRDGRVVFSQLDRLIGARPPLQPEMREALGGRIVSESSLDPTNPLERIHGISLSAYLPIRGPDNAVVGALELALPLAPITNRVADNRRSYYTAIAAGGLILWLLLLPFLVRFARLTARHYEPGRRRRLRELRKAIGQDELEVHYQPQVETATGQLVAAEALVRWRRNGELVMPASFVPLAERSGLAGLLTAQVLDRALADASGWDIENRPLRVSVNVCARDLLDERFPEKVGDALSRHRFPPELLCIEVTERALIESDERPARHLRRLAAMGIGLSLDDFGTGYSSLTRLSQLPFDEIKIDRSFVSDTGRQALLEGIVQLGHTIGLRIVAEGVEDGATLDALRELGCEIVQGYYFSRPISASEFSIWGLEPSRRPELRGKQRTAKSASTVSMT